MALAVAIPPFAWKRLSELSVQARAVYLEGLFAVAADESDGLIKAGALKRLGATRKVKAELLNELLWGDCGDRGVIVMGYLEHNPSRADTEAARERARVGMRDHRVRQRLRVTGVVTTHVTDAVTGPVTEVVTGSSVLPLASPSSLSPDLSLNPESSSALSSRIQDLKESARVSEPRAKARRKAPFPLLFTPTEEHQKRARESRLDILSEVEKCRLWHEKEGKLTASANASFTTWLIKAAEYALQHQGEIKGNGRPSEQGAYPLFKDHGRVPEGERIAPAELKGLLSSVGRRIV